MTKGKAPRGVLFDAYKCKNRTLSGAVYIFIFSIR